MGLDRKNWNFMLALESNKYGNVIAEREREAALRASKFWSKKRFCGLRDSCFGIFNFEEMEGIESFDLG